MDIICRACLDTKDALISTDSNILHNFNSMTNLQATLFDGKPQFFCCKCYECIEQFVKFREKCIESEKTLEDIVRQTKESITLDIKIEDEIKYSDGEMGSDNNDEVTDNIIMQKPTPTIKNKKTKKLNMKTKAKKTVGKKTVGKKTKPIIKDIKVLSCGICTETCPLADKDKLKLHIDSHKNDKQCKICQELFTEWPAVLGHRVIHLEKKQKNCHICQKFFATESGMEYHYRNVHFKGMQTALTCKFCSKLYDTPKKLTGHIQRMHLPLRVTFKCEHCSKICKTKQSLSTHLRVHSDIKEYICDDCGYSCRFLGTLNVHIRRKHLKMCYCTYCEKAFKNAQLLAEHKAVCTDCFTLCPVCGRKVLKRRLNKHMRVHSDFCKFKCTSCPAAFKAKTSLEEHIDRHEGNKRHQCPFCTMKFYARSLLVKHKRIHTGEKPYKCKKCSKAFTDGHNLKVHMKVHGEFLIKKKSLEPETSG